MNKRAIILIVLALLMGSVYAYKFTDWFSPREIQIFSRTLPRRGGPPSPPLFLFATPQKVTSIKVLRADEMATNKFPHALWHLVAKSNAVPVNEILYGRKIRGLQPYVEGTQPEPLEPGIDYRLLIETDDGIGQRNFRVAERIGAQ